MKKVTRRQVKSWLDPMRSCFHTMRTGEIECFRGYPVTRLHAKDEFVRVDWCCAGFRALISRLRPDINLAPVEVVEKKLAHGTPLVEAELDAVLRLLHVIEDALVGVAKAKLQDAVLIEQIAIELDSLGIKEAA